MIVPTTAVDAGAGPTRPTREGPVGPKVAYVVSRFPRLTETFVVDEAAAVRRAGAEVDLYPLHRERATVVQPAAEALAPHVHHHRLLSPAVMASQWWALRTNPRGYLGAAGAVIRHNLGSRRLLIGGIAAFPLAVHLARRFEADGVQHVHAHFATHPAVVAYVANRVVGLPYSFTAHGSDLHRDRHMLAEKVRRAAFVVAISEHNRQVVLRECGPEVADRVVVVRCGVDRRHFTPVARERRGSGSPLSLCCVGTLHEVKGQTHLVEACRRLRAAGLDVELTLVGGGPDREALAGQAEAAGLEAAVHFTGPLTHPEVRAVLEQADVLVAPSVPTADGRREGLPVVILEAMAVGIPVVASRLSGIPEAVVDGWTGLLADPGDVDGLVAALARIADEPALADRLAQRAAAVVAEDFDVDASARRLVELFEGGAP